MFPHVQSSKTDIAIPVSTRAIGFSVVDVFQNLQFLAYKNPPKTVNIYQMYRTSLGYFESKMLYNRRLFLADFETYTFSMNVEMMETFSYGRVPDPLSIVINAMAPVEADDTLFFPVLSPNKMEGNVFMPSPERVTYSNLRKTVEALSNEQVPAEIRAAFYHNNPIPGAIWNGVPSNPILQNGDEIMPKNYTFNELDDDLQMVKSVYNFLSSRKQNCFDYPLNHEAPGSTALFVCNEMGDLKIVDRNAGEELNEYQQRIMVQGNINTYWNIRNVASADQFLGCYILAGEVPSLEIFKYPSYVARDKRNAEKMTNLSYRNISLIHLIQNAVNNKYGVKSIAIPVSTRAIGFNVVDVFQKLNFWAHKKPPKTVNIYQMYRTSLGYFESKMLYNKEQFRANFETYQFPMNVEMMQVYYGNVPDPLSIVINAIAPVKAYNTLFFSILSPDNMVENVFMPSPERVTYSNLRKTVEALSNEQVPAEIRAAFYRNNPIPGAIWNGVPSNPILQNGDEIMPKDYTSKDLYIDLNMVWRVYSFLQYRERNYFNCPLNHKAHGSTALFVCNKMGDLKIVDRNVGEELNAYQQRISTQGDVDQYWNIRSVAPADQALGCYILAGEVPTLERFKYPNYVVRDERNAGAVQMVNASYRDFLVKLGKRIILDVKTMFPQSESRKRNFGIPVSTRAIGFSVVDVFQTLNRFPSEPNRPNIYQMYRTSLGYFESKMLYNELQFRDFKTYQFLYNNEEMMESLRRGNVPDPLSIVINAMAPVEAYKTLFFPVLSPDKMEGNVFMPSPERVTYSNLRKTVEALSNEQVPAEIRAAFYDNNPIPGAIWHGEPSNPILQNGDEIMPKNYTFNELDDDLQMVKSVYNFLSSRKQNCFDYPLNHEAPGSTALFVCNEMGDLKIVDRNVDEELNAYQQRIRVQGNVDRYWNIRNVAPTDRSLGCYILAGEVPSLVRFKYPNYVVRDKRNAERANESYRSISLTAVKNKYGVKSMAIPVSTRAIGFSVVDVFKKLHFLASKNTPKGVNIYQMYRTSLGYFESKMLYNEEQFRTNFESYEFPINSEAMITVFRYGSVPDSLSIVINAMAPVKAYKTLFFPVLSPDNLVGNVFMPSPERVTYSSLRKTVEALSNEQVPAEIRAAFYRNNPIPGAIWNGEPSNPILKNGDEIMPKDYTFNKLRGDLQMVSSLYDFLSIKGQKYFNNNNYRLDHNARGSAALFVCNEMGDLKVVDRNMGEELNAYQQRISTQGDVDDYWNIRNVLPADQSLGCYILAGEVPTFEKFKYPNYVVRDERNAVQRVSENYSSLSRRINWNTNNNK